MRWCALVALLVAACARAPERPSVEVPPRDSTPAPSPVPPIDRPGEHRKSAMVQPADALRAGLMPLLSTGIDHFLLRHPSYDGRGVVIGILDSGLDPGVGGLRATSAGAPKILDLRDFSREGVVSLEPVEPGPGGTLRIGTRQLTGAGRIARIAVSATWYGGELREGAFGAMPGADLNGDGSNTDVFPLIVVKASEGWVVFLDTNLDGSFEDETPLHDYRLAHETIALGSKPVTLAADLEDVGGVPSLAIFVDDAGHGTHVAGIAAGHNLFGVVGFDGVAPGAQLLGLKITDNSRGGLAVTGSLTRALDYAARFTETRGLRLVINLSFGVGSRDPGGAALDSVLDAFLLAHPDVVLTASAGNDGPGLSTTGVPGAADLALTTAASLPGPFGRQPPRGRASDVLGWWSARGGALAKPDLVTPGVAYSVVPSFDRGGEVKAGTSMAAPYAAGLAACLLSAMVQESRAVSATEIIQALRASAGRLPWAGVLDEGAGEPDLDRAYRWLEAGHQGSQYVVRTTGGLSAAFFRDGPPDSTVFTVRPLAGLRAAAFVLRRDVAWIDVPPMLSAGTVETEIPVYYSFPHPSPAGAYTGTVTAFNPSDTLAGPLFRLVTTVVVPSDLSRAPLADTNRVIGPNRIARYFLRAPDSNATLTVSVGRADTVADHAMVRLYAAGGRPVAESSEVELGHGVRLGVPAEDLEPGVYELDVIATPFAPLTASVHAELAPLELEVTNGALEARNPGTRTVAGVLHETLLGSARTYEVAGDSAETLSVTPPAWAGAVEIDVSLPQAVWDRLQGFGVTVRDSSGAVVRTSPLDGPVGRDAFALPEALRGHALALELLPAFAVSSAPWHCVARVAFLDARPEPLGTPAPVIVVGGGRVVLPPVPAPAIAVPTGFSPLVLARVRPTGGGTEAIRRFTLAP
ncbi:MAG TPA: S8 family serine peptidase [Gemmatimonadales bacterium]|nr:S8 family serine peptidase [Gemmatimonadales bacterium]